MTLQTLVSQNNVMCGQPVQAATVVVTLLLGIPLRYRTRRFNTVKPKVQHWTRYRANSTLPSISSTVRLVFSLFSSPRPSSLWTFLRNPPHHTSVFVLDLSTVVPMHFDWRRSKHTDPCTCDGKVTRGSQKMKYHTVDQVVTHS
jgi:hypothetical protein